MRSLAPAATPAAADPAEIVGGEATPGAGGWRFDVTLRHRDTGWDDADGWRVELPTAPSSAPATSGTPTSRSSPSPAR